VGIEGVRIGAVGPPPADAERLPGRLLLPGFVNAHSHAFQRLLRGHVQHAEGPDDFWSWRERMYQLATSLDPDGVEEASRLAFREMLAAGFTTVGEFHYLHHQPDGTPYADPDELAGRVVAAARSVGIRLKLLRVAYARAGFGVAPVPRQRRFIDKDADDVLAAVSRLNAAGVDAGLAPHSVRAVPAEWLRAFAAFDGVIHAHVDEQPAEVRASLAEHGRRPVHVFEAAGLLSPRFTAVHLTHPDEAELATMAASGASTCACPTTELDLGDGFLPIDRIRGPVCIGSDSHAAIDPFAEMRAIEWNARAMLGRRNVVPHAGPDGLAAALLAMGTVNGARALGIDAGEIAVGRLADLVAVDVSGVAFQRARLLPAVVFNGSPACVRQVWVGGERRL
jgi:formimidoylglutamate deiminase